MEIHLKYPTTKFKEYLEFKNNSRILFSGKFGTGKTYFLKKYFENNINFSTFHLYPTNYQVTQNEDIFELIKFDILLKLIDKEWIKPDNQINNKLAIQSYFLTAGGDLLSPILKSIPKVGKVFETFENIVLFFDSYKKHIDSLNNNTLNLLREFGEIQENQKGSIYEQDLISNIITESIVEFKKESSSILIIDDLDRVDPEHVFRILNIFSAHFDLETNFENKFNFDKIIVVCDLLNLEKIFHSKYGIDSDFHGYINKFYSNSCFIFDNKNSVEDGVKKLISDYINKSDNNLKEILHYYVLPILIDFIHADVITLRDIFHIRDSTYQNAEIYSFYLGSRERVENFQFSIILLFDFLEFVFGNNKNKLKIALRKCEQNIQKTNLNKIIIDELILLSFPNELVSLKCENELIDTHLKLKFKFKIIEKSVFSVQPKYIAEKLTILNERDIETTIKSNDIYYLMGKSYDNILSIKKEEVR